MSSLQFGSTVLFNNSSSCYCSNIKSMKRINCAINVPKASSTTRKLVDQGLHKFKETTAPLFDKKNDSSIIKILHDSSKITNTKFHELYAVLEAVSDRIEMHNNMKEQRQNWNTLLLNSINMITLTASTMAGVAAATTDHHGSSFALEISSALLFSAATGMLLVMNKIQPSQLAEEQRNATRLFKQLHNQIQTTIIALINDNNNNNSNEEGDEIVKSAIEKVLALDKGYPLPLLGGAMLEKFPSKFEPARWWPSPNNLKNEKVQDDNNNGWNMELEREMREVIEVVKRNDKEEYERLGNLALKMNKALAISGPLLTGIAALGCVAAFLGGNNNGAMVGVVGGAMAAVENAIEHGGQVGMVFEMYRNCGGFFQLLEEEVEATLEEDDLDKRENGELFEMNMALKLGRSVSELRQLASPLHATHIDEFASKLF